MANTRKTVSGKALGMKRAPKTTVKALEPPAMDDASHEAYHLATYVLSHLSSPEAPPLERLDAAQILNALLDELTSRAVSDARALDISWRSIASALKLSVGTTHGRFGDDLPPAHPYWVELGRRLRVARTEEKGWQPESIRASHAAK